jgi:hypothetical protein
MLNLNSHPLNSYSIFFCCSIFYPKTLTDACLAFAVVRIGPRHRVRERSPYALLERALYEDSLLYYSRTWAYFGSEGANGLTCLLKYEGIRDTFLVTHLMDDVYKRCFTRVCVSNSVRPVVCDSA